MKQIKASYFDGRIRLWIKLTAPYLDTRSVISQVVQTSMKQSLAVDFTNQFYLFETLNLFHKKRVFECDFFKKKKGTMNYSSVNCQKSIGIFRQTQGVSVTLAITMCPSSLSM